MRGAAHTRCLSLSYSNYVIFTLQRVMAVFQSLFLNTRNSLIDFWTTITKQPIYQQRTRLEVLIDVLLKISIFWDVTPCRWAATSRRFEGSWCSWPFGHVVKPLLFFDTSENTGGHGVVSQKMGIIVTNSNLESCYIYIEDDKETVLPTYLPPCRSLF